MENGVMITDKMTDHQNKFLKGLATRKTRINNR